MSAILKFITVMEKILIIICIICFIPTSIFIYLPKPHTFQPTHIAVYNLAYRQLSLPFIISLSNNNCTYKQAIFNNEYCFVRASANYIVRIVGEGTGCQGYSYKYEGVEFCSGTTVPIDNMLTNNNSNPILIHNDTDYPIFSTTWVANTPYIQKYHYLSSKKSTCSSLAKELSQDIQTKYSLFFYKAFQDSSKLLWYYSLPVLAILIGLAIVNEVSNNYNLRKYILMGGLTINIALITLIVKTAVYFSDLLNFQNQILSFSECFVSSTKATISQMAYFDFGIGYGFVFFMGVVALIIFLSMVGLLVAKLLELKYYSSREVPQQVGVELSDIRSSLRSRMIKGSSTSIQPQKKILLQSEA